MKTVAQLKKLLPSTAKTVEASKSIVWSQRGGHAGTKTVDRVSEKAEAVGFALTSRQPSGLSGRVSVYQDEAGNVLTLSCHYGSTKFDNRFDITLKLA